MSENPRVKGQHTQHLAAYWSVYYFATAGEVLGYFMLHEDLFTLITCFKTTLLLAFWLGRNEDKTFVCGHYTAYYSNFPGELTC